MVEELGAENRWHSLGGDISLPAFSVIRKAWLVPIVRGNDGMKAETSTCEGEGNNQEMELLGDRKAGWPTAEF